MDPHETGDGGPVPLEKVGRSKICCGGTAAAPLELTIVAPDPKFWPEIRRTISGSLSNARLARMHWLAEVLKA